MGSAMAELMEVTGVAASRPEVVVDQTLASLWFAWSIHPIDWERPPVFDAIAGDYQTKDGWIRLHTYLPHHRAAALKALGVEATREKIAAAMGAQSGEELEAAGG